MFLTMPLRIWPSWISESRFSLELLPLLFDHLAARDDDVAAGLVDLEDHALDFAADVVADVGRAADIDLAGRQEHVHADVDQQAALDLPLHHPLDDVAFLLGADDVFPLADAVGLALGQQDQAELVFNFFEQHGHFVAGLGQRGVAVPFVERDDALALVADVDQHLVAFDADDGAVDDGIDVDAAAGSRDVEVFEAFVLSVLGFGEGVAECRFEVRVFDVEFAEQISINHAESLSGDAGLQMLEWRLQPIFICKDRLKPRLQPKSGIVAAAEENDRHPVEVRGSPPSAERHRVPHPAAEETGIVDEVVPVRLAKAAHVVVVQFANLGLG